MAAPLAFPPAMQESLTCSASSSALGVGSGFYFSHCVGWLALLIESSQQSYETGGTIIPISQMSKLGLRETGSLAQTLEPELFIRFFHGTQ